MLRRNFIKAATYATAAWPCIATGQQSANKTWRIAHVYPGKYDNASDRTMYDVFRTRLKELGYVEGKNLIIDQRAAEGKLERLPSILNELISLHPDVIVAILNSAIAAAQKVTSTIPIIMAPSINPVGYGFVKSLARPGANITGVSSMTDDVMGKTVEVLHTLLPSAKRVAVLLSNNPNHPWQYELAASALRNVGLAAVRVVAPTANDLEHAFEAMKKEASDALLMPGDLTRLEVIPLAARSGMPTIYTSSAYVPMGGLISYSPTLAEFYRMTAQFCGRIFRGANPADVPVEQPVIFDLAVNLKTAAALGLTVPPSILASADTVIE
ncbi:ABC transporter substrate-binding protein [Bradyrhizobium sp. KB893862 SZCCT0404]|uniref:ABC transporter substrate-binding protein n=1 Tax=Bradyrhizobium sp. KB893862 SZCCT0404 TaxID=2807672 RepID=UPI001BA8275D|nr:ABC transporter substrate-binding protein [Bradyrhizobium sp. KB893862 SZCCT0404]MBR1172687.1 ABC transporter substrate-binding protein [Bradyrhizobium sp. KB893862 SZCCT0404]